MAAQETPRSFTEGVASRVLEACRKNDPESRITYVGRDETGRTVVRIRAGPQSSVVNLQRVLSKHMPYAIVRTSEDVLDGTVQVQVVVPTIDDEWALAKRQVQRQLVHRVLQATSLASALLGLGVWVAGVTNEGVSAI